MPSVRAVGLGSDPQREGRLTPEKGSERVFAGGGWWQIPNSEGLDEGWG